MASEGAAISRSWNISRMRGEEPKTPEKSNTLSPGPLRQTMDDAVTATGRSDQNVAMSALKKLRATQDLSADPYGRGDTWAEWGENNPSGAKGTGRPPQFLGQTRPVTVGFILSYGQPSLAAAAKSRGLK